MHQQKWKEYGTCVSLPVTGFPHKLCDCKGHQDTLPQGHRWEGWERQELPRSFTSLREPKKKKIHSKSSRVLKMAWERLPALVKESSLVWRDQIWAFLVKMSCLAQTKHCTSPQTQHTHCQAWWWEHHTKGMLVSSQPLKTCEKN